jgi:ABC-2 type transport system ATP-binding protein
MARRWWVSALAAGLLLACLTTAGASAPVVTAHDFTVTSTIDGTQLVARYYRPAGRGSYPVVLAPHGGGGTVDSEAPRAARYAALGFVGVVWSARGHGSSGGVYDLFGPKTVQDTEDVLQWVIAHRAETGADPQRAGAIGLSQGGATVNLIGARDPRIKVLAPGQTFAGLSESLHPNGCMKLSVDSAILGAAYTAQGARLDPTLTVPWSAYLTTGQGGGTVEPQWTSRSPRTFADRTPQPTLWVQAFDDPLFPVDQALAMQALRRHSDVRLWLSWGGHFAASSTARELDQREAAWTGWLQHVLQGKATAAARLPRVTWWYRAADGSTLVRRSATSWPPAGVRPVTLALAAGTVTAAGTGTADDPVVAFGERSAPSGEQVGQVLAALPRHSAAETLVSTGAPLVANTLVAGAPRADLTWSSTATDSQLVVKLYDVAPDGSAALLSRGCTAVHGPTQHVGLALSHTAVEVRAGHHFEVWVQGSDAPTWLPAQQPAADTVGPRSRLVVPLLKP